MARRPPRSPSACRIFSHDFFAMTRILWIVFPALALAQSGANGSLPRVPVLGYFGSGSSVRPIVGAPGAVVLGGAIALPDGISEVTPVPMSNFAIAESAGASESAVIPLNVDSAGEVRAIESSFAHSDRIAFSSSGTVAALYSSSAQQAQILVGLPENPRVDRSVDLSAPGLPLTALAVSDDAQTILAGFSDGSSGAVWAFANGADPRQIAAAGNPSALRFFAASNDSVLADAAWQQIILLRDGSAPQVLAGPGQGIAAPADLEISGDGQTVRVADSSGKLFSIDLGSGAVDGVDSSVQASALVRLAPGVLLLGSADGTSLGIWTPQSTNRGVWRIAGANSQ